MSDLDAIPHPAWVAMQERDALLNDLIAARAYAATVCGVEDASDMNAADLVRAAFTAGFDEGISK